MAARAETSAQDIAAVETYIASTPEPFRAALAALRAQIRSAASQAGEALVYGVPGFRHGGRPLVCYAAFKSHCGFYPMSPALLDSLADELTGFRVAKGTIRFTPEQPLPDGLVRRIVTARLRENAAGTTT